MINAIETRYAQWGARQNNWWDIVLAHIRLVRPTTRVWFDVIMPLAVMLVMTGGQLSEAVPLVIVVTLLLHTAGTILNDVRDAEADRLSPELLRRTRPVATGVVSKRWGLIAASLLCAAGLVVASLINLWVVAACGVLSVLIAMHELPPVRTQSRPILSQVAGVFGLTCILFTIALAVGVDEILAAIPFLIFIALYMGLAEMLVKDIRDVESDGAGGKTTTAVKYGAAGATRIATYAYLATALPWVWFALSYPGVNRAPLILGTVILFGWIIATGSMARRLEHSPSQRIYRSLHRGSVLVLTAMNICVIAAFL